MKNLDFKAVVFDFDGVVADTMNDNYLAWKQAFAFYHVDVAQLDYFLLEGMGRFDIARTLSKKLGISPQFEKEIVEAKEANYKAINQFRVYPEIYPIFTLLDHRNIKMGLATGASKMRITNTLSHELSSFFSVIVTADDIVKGKPDPEPYLKAIQKLEFSASECLVIENAKLGISSAKAAGCTCFALETTVSATHLQEADAIFSNHTELYNHLITI